MKEACQLLIETDHIVHASNDGKGSAQSIIKKFLSSRPYLRNDVACVI